MLQEKLSALSIMYVVAYQFKLSSMTLFLKNNAKET
jgi:hypothetical protein